MGDQEHRENRRLEVASVDNTEDDTCRTFVMHKEDHTLGNALRYMVMKNPNVKFCGYSVPHPSENKINFRIQTNGPPATDALKKGLLQLSMVSEHVLSTFEKNVENFKNTKSAESMEVDT